MDSWILDCQPQPKQSWLGHNPPLAKAKSVRAKIMSEVILAKNVDEKGNTPGLGGRSPLRGIWWLGLGSNTLLTSVTFRWHQNCKSKNPNERKCQCGKKSPFTGEAVFPKRHFLGDRWPCHFDLEICLGSGRGCQNIFQTLAEIQTTSVPASPPSSPHHWGPFLRQTIRFCLLPDHCPAGHTRHTCFKPTILSSSLSASWLALTLHMFSREPWSDLRSYIRSVWPSLVIFAIYVPYDVLIWNHFIAIDIKSISKN